VENARAATLPSMPRSRNHLRFAESLSSALRLALSTNDSLILVCRSEPPTFQDDKQNDFPSIQRSDSFLASDRKRSIVIGLVANGTTMPARLRLLRARGGRSGLPHRRSNAEVSPSVAAAPRMSAVDGKRTLAKADSEPQPAESRRVTGSGRPGSAHPPRSGMAYQTRTPQKYARR
jgi:hypothetical protein